jgi:hypothetical protein
MITLDGTHGWVISYTNKHNISGKVVEDINTGNWTFCTSIKPEWNKDNLLMNIDGINYRGGVLCRNGMHSGIFNVLWQTEDKSKWLKSIKGEIWYDTPGGETEVAIMEYKVRNEEWIDIILSYDRKSSKLKLQAREEGEINWDIQEIDIDGEIIDYSGSHVWIGCANGFESCPEPQFYQGHIRCLGVFNSVLTESDRDKFYNEYQDFKGIPKYFRSNAHKRQVYNFEKMNPLALTNFKTTTPYKAFDFSGNGNHPIIYKREWGVY